ncbi:MAG: hypothetical protein WAZ27_03365 [Minisyncoccia bacterium]
MEHIPVLHIAISLARSLNLEQAAVLIVLFHILGYTLYILRSLLREIEPNPITWLMFTYSTLITLYLEYALGASGYLLYLPAVCAAGSVVVAIICYFRGQIRIPNPGHERTAFRNDLILMACALAAFALHKFGAITDFQKYVALAAFLVFSNWSTFYAFAPIIQDAKENPGREHSHAWVVWTIAYAGLGGLTVAGWIQEGALDRVMLALLLLYPLSCTYLHAKVAWYARSTRHGGKRVSMPIPAE